MSRVSEARVTVACEEHGEVVAAIVEYTEEGVAVMCAQCLRDELNQDIALIDFCLEEQESGSPDFIAYEQELEVENPLDAVEFPALDDSIPVLPYFRTPEAPEG